MATDKKLYLLLLFFFLGISSFGQNTEEQRKYIFGKDTSVIGLLPSISALSGMQIYSHSVYYYEDIYLDSPTFDLAKKGYSLRFRKRNFEDGSISYSMQLKNEMTELSAIRMEVDEPELDFYTLQKSGEWVSITTVLDPLFAHLSSQNPAEISPKTAASMELICEWIRFKASAPISPFQKIRFLEGDVVGLEIIQKLAPVLVGSSRRSRMHVYLDPTTSKEAWKQLPKNKIAASLLPEFFRKNPTFTWLLEASVDASHFYSLVKPQKRPFDIAELEVENKYSEKLEGTKFLDIFEKTLTEDFGLKKEYASKYKQSVTFFGY